MKKLNTVRLFCSCGWQELVSVDSNLNKEEAWKSCNKIQEEHMKMHDPNFNLNDYEIKHIGHSKKLIN